MFTFALSGRVLRNMVGHGQLHLWIVGEERKSLQPMVCCDVRETKLKSLVYSWVCESDRVRVEGVLETDPKALEGQIPFRFVAHKVELQHPYKVPVIIP